MTDHIEVLRGLVAEAAGCITAAFVEGWPDALADGDIERIRDIWARRISYALPAMESALAAMGAQGEDDAWCAECGVKLENVRPGKHQHPTCSQAAPQQPEAQAEPETH